MAFVILRPQSVHTWAGRTAEFADTLKKHARARLPGFACPEWVEVVEELPVSSVKTEYENKLMFHTENIDWQDTEGRPPKDGCEALSAFSRIVEDRHLI